MGWLQLGFVQGQGVSQLGQQRIGKNELPHWLVLLHRFCAAGNQGVSDTGTLSPMFAPFPRRQDFVCLDTPDSCRHVIINQLLES